MQHVPSNGAWLHFCSSASPVISCEVSATAEGDTATSQHKVPCLGMRWQHTRCRCTTGKSHPLHNGFAINNVQFVDKIEGSHSPVNAAETKMLCQMILQAAVVLQENQLLQCNQ